MIIKNLKIKSKHIDAIIHYHQKIKELENSNFFKFYFKENIQLQLKAEAKKVQNGWVGRIGISEPPEESIKAFILDFRFFIIGNERSSLQYLGDEVLPALEPFFQDEVKNFKNFRKVINQFLQSPPMVNLKLTRGNKTKEFKINEEIFDCFIFGHYAHANIKKDQKEWYDFIHLHAEESYHKMKREFFRLDALNIIVNITAILIEISKLIDSILEKIINHHILQCEKLFKENDNRSIKKEYSNALYIANQLENKDLRAELYKKLYVFYEHMNELNKAETFLARYKDIKNSIREFASDFWNEEYYREFYSIPKEYLDIMKQIFPDYQDLLENPIIILPLERLYEVDKFRNLIAAKNFRLSERSSENRRVKLYYKQIISIQQDKPLWIPQEFEFNPENGFICRFPFRDFSGILFITNSPELFIEGLYMWIEEKNLFQNLLYYYNFFFLYLEYLVFLEINNSISKELFKKLINLRNSPNQELIYNSILPKEQQFLVAKHVSIILHLFIDMVIFPKLEKVISTTQKRELLKNRDIQPHLNNTYRGQSWVSFNLIIILYYFLTDDDSIYNEKKNPELIQLKEICELIKGKKLSSEFFEKFFEFCCKYMEKYVLDK